MSVRKRKREAPMPASSAGLLRFFEDETHGVRVKPEVVVGLAIVLIILSVVIKLLI